MRIQSTAPAAKAKPNKSPDKPKKPSELEKELRDKFQAREDSLERSSGLRKWAWMGGTAAALGGAALAARPMLAGLSFNPLVTASVGAVAGGLVGSVLHASSVPLHPWNGRPHTGDKIENFLVSGSSAALGALLTHNFGQLGPATVVPILAAAGGIAVGYGLHLTSSDKVRSKVAKGIFEKKYLRQDPVVEPRNVFVPKEQEPTPKPKGREYWLDPNSHIALSPETGKPFSIQLNSLQNFAEDSLQGVTSLLLLDGTDPTNPNDKKEKGYYLAYGHQNWRFLEDKLQKQSSEFDSEITREVFGNIKTLSRPNGRKALLESLGLKAKHNRELKERDFTIYQFGEGGADKPALVNGSLPVGDASFFFAKAEDAKRLLDEADENDMEDFFGDYCEKANITVYSSASKFEEAVLVGSSSDGLIFMGQDERNKSSFRLHVAAVLDKGLRDMKEVSDG